MSPKNSYTDTKLYKCLKLNSYLRKYILFWVCKIAIAKKAIEVKSVIKFYVFAIQRFHNLTSFKFIFNCIIALTTIMSSTNYINLTL